MAEATGRRRDALPAVLLLAAAPLSILAQGFALPSAINAYHYPVLFDWAASAEGPRDAFVLSLQHFVTYLWPALALLVSEGNVGWLLPLLHLASRLALLLLFYALLDHLLPGRRRQAALLAAALVAGMACTIASPLGHGEVLLDSFSHSSLNPPLALAIWLAALRRQWWLAALLLGLLFNVNAFVAAWLGLALLLGCWWQARARPAPTPLRALWPAALLLVAVAAPTLWRILETLAATRPRLPAYDFRDFLRAYYPGHFFTDTTPAAEKLVFLLLLAGLAWLLATLRGRLLEADRRLLGGAALGLALVVGFGALLPLVSGSRLLLNAHPLRMDFLLVWLGYLAFAAWTLARPRLDSLLLAAWLALFAGFWLPLALLLPLREAGASRRPLVLLALLLALAVALAGALPASGGPPRQVSAGLLLLLLAALAAAGPALGRGSLAALAALAALQLAGGFGGPPGAWALAGALLLLLAWDFATPGGRRWTAPGAIALGCLAAWFGREDPRLAALLAGAAPLALLGAWLLPRLAQARGLRLPVTGLPAAGLLLALLLVAAPGAWHLARSGHLDRYDERALAFLELQRWARGATPPHSLFLPPPEQYVLNGVPSFWTLSRRPVYVDWRMGAAAHWQPDFWWQWQARLAAVRALPDAASRLAFAGAEGIDYLILAPGETLPPDAPTPLHDNGVYRVIAVPR